MSHESEVKQASGKFYAALNRMVSGDPSHMKDVWSHGREVTSMHPTGGRETGWDKVEEVFKQVSGMASAGKVELKDQFIHAEDDLAYELGTEVGTMTMDGHAIPISHRVTNIYHREGGAWKLVHHHTDTSPALMDMMMKGAAAKGKAGKSHAGKSPRAA